MVPYTPQCIESVFTVGQLHAISAKYSVVSTLNHLARNVYLNPQLLQRNTSNTIVKMQISHTGLEQDFDKEQGPT